MIPNRTIVFCERFCHLRSFLLQTPIKVSIEDKHSPPNPHRWTERNSKDYQKESGYNKKFTGSVTRFGGTISYAAFYGLISTIVPFGANLSISSISSSVTAIHPFVQSTSV